MVDNEGYSERKEFHGARIQILGTNLDKPEKGRVFVWTKMGWFERLKGPSGDVAFTPIADSEKELRELILRENPQADLSMLGGKFRKMVSEEFTAQSPSNSSFLEESSEESGEDDDEEDDQEYHQHGL
jgi:hypothetical protein